MRDDGEQDLSFHGEGRRRDFKNMNASTKMDIYKHTQKKKFSLSPLISVFSLSSHSHERVETGKGGHLGFLYYYITN